VVLIPIDADDILPGRELRTEFARFWSTEQGEPRDIYDRFIALTPIANGVSVEHVSDPAPGVWVRPADAVADRAILFLHGGGYGQGRVQAYVGLISQIAARTRVAAFALEYPLAPEAQLPDALNLAVATLSRLLGDHAAVAIVGDSAGGGLSLATAQTHGGDAGAAAVAVFSPWTDLTLSGASMSEFAIGDPLLDPPYLHACASQYLGPAAPDDPRGSPLFGDMEALPPVLIQVGTDEILADDSRRFADSLEKAGGTVELEVWQGMHHVFQLNVVQLVSARKALDSTAEFLTTHLFD
jgi:monoterpene epsilon-lactone hydrolase